MFALIAEHEGPSTLTVKDFCELYDLSPGMYYYWQNENITPGWKKSRQGIQSSFTLLKVAEREKRVWCSGSFCGICGIRFYREPSVSF